MRKHELYTYSRLETSSIRKLKALLQDLQPYVDRTGWVAEEHDIKLETKVVGKIARIRTDMVKRGELKRSGDGYMLTDNSASPRPSLDEWKAVADRLSTEELWAANQFCLHLLHDRCVGDGSLPLEAWNGWTTVPPGKKRRGSPPRSTPALPRSLHG